MRCICDDTKIIRRDIGFYHCFNCSAGDNLFYGPASDRMKAHNHIRDAVKDFCKACVPLGSTVEIERCLPHTVTSTVSSKDKPQLRADVFCIPAGEIDPIVIDIRTSSPTGINPLKHGSSHIALIASSLGEQEKIRKYKTSYPDHNGETHPSLVKFVPFVVECTGALGVKASNFVAQMVSKMCADASDEDKDGIHKAKDVLIREVNQAMSRFRSQNYRYFMNNVKMRLHGTFV
jgi:hypothetical protein